MKIEDFVAELTPNDQTRPELLVFALQFRTTDGRVKQMSQMFAVAKNMSAALVEVEEFLASPAGKGFEINAIQASGVVLPGNLPGGILRDRD